MRKEIDFTITAEGRDKGKTYHITEMSAMAAQEFADRLFFAAMNQGVEIPDGIEKLGMAGLWHMGISMASRVPYEWAKPLLDTLMNCVKLRATPEIIRPLEESDIEEFMTVFTLRKQVMKLHFDFFGSGGGSTSESKSQETKTTA